MTRKDDERLIEIWDRLRRQERLLYRLMFYTLRILKGEQLMSQELDDLTAQVHGNTDAIDSATTLINGIADRIKAAGTDPAKLKALTDELKQKDSELAQAGAANTPVDAQ